MCRTTLATGGNGGIQGAFHIVPAFRGFNLPGINLAEIGHSTMHVPVLMSLAVAAWHDMCTMMIQDSEYDAFINNKAKVSGKGLNLKQRRQKEHLQDSKFVDAALEVLQSGNIEAEAMLNMDPDRYFEPSKCACHRVPEVYSSTNPQQKKKGHKRRKRQDKENEDQFDNHDDNDDIDPVQKRNCLFEEYDIVPARVEITKLNTNPPVLVFLTALMNQCAGCELKFTAADRNKPNGSCIQIHDVLPNRRWHWRDG